MDLRRVRKVPIWNGCCLRPRHLVIMQNCDKCRMKDECKSFYNDTINIIEERTSINLDSFKIE